MLLIILALLMLGTGVLRAADTFPPAPAHYFNDLAHVTHGDTANQLDQKLQQFERDTSNQILVAVFDKYPSQDDVASYSNNLFRAWKIGQAHKNNGVGLFVWIANHKLFISTGYGLEGALPDATCKQIIDNEITPHFKTGDYDGGLTAGVDAILAATKGEYKGTGHTQGDGSQQNNSLFWFIVAVFIVFTLLSMWRNGRRGYGYSRSGSGWGPFISFGGGFGSGGGFSGGGGFGGGGFSGGGGSSGGGGAGGSW